MSACSLPTRLPSCEEQAEGIRSLSFHADTSANLGIVLMNHQSYAPYGGEEAGSGLADVLFGKVNPRGRLPLTIYKQGWADEMNCKNYTESPGRARNYIAPCNTSILRLDLDASVGRTHRYIRDTQRYVSHAFGFGLSYTTFKYAKFTASHGLLHHRQPPHELVLEGSERGVRSANTDSSSAPPPPPHNVTFDVRIENTGAVDGAEIVQIYMQGAVVPGLVTAKHNLIGFARVDVAKGAAATVQISIDDDSWKTAQADGSSTIVPGSYTVFACGHQPTDQEGNNGSSGACLSMVLQL